MNLPREKTEGLSNQTVLLEARSFSSDEFLRPIIRTRKPATLTAESLPSKKVAGMTNKCNRRFSHIPKRDPPAFFLQTCPFHMCGGAPFILPP